MPRFDVTLAGEMNLDLILYGLPEKLPRERELLANDIFTTLGGTSANVAHNLASFGSRVGFQSCIGSDEMGQLALAKLSESGVDISRVRELPPPARSPLTVVLQHEGWRTMLTYCGTAAELSWEDLNFSYLSDSRHFHLSGFYLQKRLQPRVAELFRKLKDAGLTISLDTNDDPDDTWEGLSEALKYVDVFLPNEREAQRVAGTTDVDAAARKLAEIVPIVVVKLGARGSMAQRGKERVVRPGLKVKTVDEVGAGDSFDAGFLHAYVRGADLATCLENGNLSGALSTTRPGGTEAFRDREHRERFIQEHGGNSLLIPVTSRVLEPDASLESEPTVQ